MSKRFFKYLLVLLVVICSQGLGNPADTDEKLTLKLQDVPVVDVMNMIAMQYGLNVVVGGGVTGDVTIHLENVDIYSALDAILTSNGYNYFIKGNVIVVKPIDQAADGELESRLIVLKYVSPMTAQKALESRLSDRGKVIILDKSAANAPTGETQNFQPNRILITDRSGNLQELVKIIGEIDVPERLIQIEAKIIETTIDNTSKLGFQWPTSISTSLSDVNYEAVIPGSTTETESSDISRKAAFQDLEGGKWTWGKLSVNELNMVLDLLERTGNSKIVSDPHLTTLENHEAEIKIEKVFPIQTINRFTEGAATQDIVTFQDVEVGISLKVTPRINPDGQITLEVEPTVEDIIGYSGTADNQKPITISRSINTTVSVKNGESVALGGLLKDDEIVNEQKVPLLGHIPFLGGLLFTNKSVSKTKSDLIIFITPRILQ